MESTALRELARRYADRELDRDSYRQQRAALLEALLEGDWPEPLTRPNYTSPKDVTEAEAIPARTFRNHSTTTHNAGNDDDEIQYRRTQPIQLSEAPRWPSITLIAIAAGILIALGFIVLYL